MVVTVRAENDEGDSFCGGIRSASLEQNCADKMHFVIDCDEQCS